MPALRPAPGKRDLLDHLPGSKPDDSRLGDHGLRSYLLVSAITFTSMVFWLWLPIWSATLRRS